MQRFITVAAASILAAPSMMSCLPAFCNDNQVAKITSAIKAAKILPASAKFNVGYSSASKEVSISTFVNQRSKNLESDCKIDTLLMAHKVIETEKNVLHVRARFYGADVSSYREVIVSKSDIAAFSSGSIDKDELLSSLQLVEHRAEAGQQAAPSLGKNIVAFKDRGLAFCYPTTWQAKPMNNQYGDIVELSAQRQSWCSIMPRLQGNSSADEAVEHEKQYFFDLNKRKILDRKNVGIGPNSAMTGILIDVKDDSDPAHPDRYETHVYFGKPHKIFSFSIRFCQADRAFVETDLRTILSTIALY